MTAGLTGPVPAIAPPVPQEGGDGEFRGTGRLLRLALRRDRIRVPAWALLFGLQCAASYSATAGLYPDTRARAQAAEVFNTAPSLVAMFGRVYDIDSVGALATIKLVAFYAAAIAVVMVFHVVRHTRADEDAGRLELLSATAIGRWAPLAAALLSATILTSLIGLAASAGLAAGGADPAGALAFGMGWALTGLVFAMFTGVIAQVVPEARPTIGIGVGAVGLAYLLRAVGDLQTPPPGWASWLSPIGWSQQLRPFAGNRFWVALLPLAAAVGLAGLAMVLRSRRDLGAGMIPERPGSATTRIASPFALSLRLNRGLLIGWAVGLVLMGGVVGSLSNSLDSFLEDPNVLVMLEKLGGRKALLDLFLSLELGIMCAAVAAVGISVISHLRREEEDGRTELVMSGPTSRGRWVAGSLIVALGGVALLMALLGLAAGAGAAAATGDGGLVGSMLVAALVRVPAAWVVTGIAVALYGLAPRFVALTWVALLGFLIIGDFGALWGLPDWVAKISPFAHSPNLPGGDLNPGSLVALTLVAVLLLAVGIAGWRRRDLLTA